jgi:hypothetical protein
LSRLDYVWRLIAVFAIVAGFGWYHEFDARQKYQEAYENLCRRVADEALEDRSPPATWTQTGWKSSIILPDVD